jgi:tetratricopeptide (TPR) repeat protein
MKINVELQNAIKGNELIIFVGAGYSSTPPLNIPTWRNLIYCFITELISSFPEVTGLDILMSRLKNNTIDEITALQELFEKGFENECMDILKKEVDINLTYKDLTKFTNLWKITNRIVTTNYDKAIETSNNGVTVFTHLDKKEIASLEKKHNYLWKLHGCISKHNDCILFKEKYDELYKNNRLFTFELRNLFAHKTILFIGFSLNDPYIVDILSDLREIYEGHKGKNLLLTTKNDDFSKYDVETVKLNNWNELDSYLDELVNFRNGINFGVEQAYNFKIQEFEEKGIRYNSEEVKKDIEILFSSISENYSEIEIDIQNGDFDRIDSKLEKSLQESLLRAKYYNKKSAEIAFKCATSKRIQLKYSEALIFYRQAVDLYPLNSEYLNELGSILHDLGQFENAINYYKQSIEVELKGNNPISNNIGDRYSNIGEALSDLQDYESALKFYEKAIATDTKIFGSKHPKIGHYYLGIGGIWREKNDNERALEFYNRALEIALNNNGSEIPNSQVAGSSYYNIGYTLMELKEFRLAANNFGEAIKYDSQHYSPSDKHFLLTIQYLGYALEQIGDVREIIHYYHQVAEFEIKNFGERYEQLAHRYSKLGTYYRQIGVLSFEALDYFKKALSICLESFGENHPLTANCYNDIGVCLFNSEKYDEAYIHYGLALSIDISHYGSSHHCTATDYYNLGLTSEKLNDYQTAQILFEKALPILNDTLGQNHEYSTGAKRHLDNIKKGNSWWNRVWR